MRHRRFRFLRWPVLLVLSPVLLVLALSGCHRGSWHDPERLESRMAHIEEDLHDDLEIRPEQEADFRALSENLKAHARNRVQRHRETTDALKAEFAQDTVNADQVGGTLKGAIRERAQRIDEHEALVDQAVAFYKTLDPEQQAVFNQKVRRKLDWID